MEHRQRRLFSESFKREAVDRVANSGLSAGKVADELGLHETALFFANIGGFLTGLLFGFTGLEPGGGASHSWARRPIILPEGWSSIDVERVWIRGEPMRLTARQGSERAELNPAA